MSGGGSDKKKTDPKTPATTTPTPSVPAQTFQPMMPGFGNMLAEQLQAGYGSGGGTVPDFLSMLTNMYQPMTLGTKASTGGSGGSSSDNRDARVAAMLKKTPKITDWFGGLDTARQDSLMDKYGYGPNWKD